MLIATPGGKTTLHRALQAAVARAAEGLGASPEAVRAAPIDVPPKPELGDLSTPLALKLARELRRRPLDVAADLQAALAADPALRPWVAAVEVAPPGFVNFRLATLVVARAAAAQAILAGPAYGDLPLGAGEKVLIEHTSVNPNKAMHIGHLRNACIGDTFARLYRRAGHAVEVQNYIDDTGVQVADVLVGLEALGRVPDERRFDLFCWDLYTEVNAAYDERPDLVEARRQVLRRVEEGSNPTAALGRAVADAIVRCHLFTLWQFGITFDLLSWESDIIGLGLWRHAFEVLKATGALVHETEGPNAGCWVVKLGDVPGFAAMENPDKILVRSDGTATYTAKDLAYQMWKFGLLGRDFRYRPYLRQPHGGWVWSTTSRPERADAAPADAAPEAVYEAPFPLRVPEAAARGIATPPGDAGTPGAAPAGADAGAGLPRPVWAPAGTATPDGPPPAFGRADVVINVIDVRQKYLQDVLRASLRKLGYERQAERSIHFGYEVVALSARAARELGVEVGEAAAAVAMAGRKGIGVKVDDLLDLATEKARAEVRSRHPDWPDDLAAATARAIATAAIRYYMLRHAMTTVIVFDFEEALSLQGNTGPYLQYAHARAASILRRAFGDGWRGAVERLAAGLGEAGGGGGAAAANPAGAAPAPQVHGLALRLAEWPEVVARAVETGTPNLVAEYAFVLAQAFTAFYEHVPVLAAPEPERPTFLGLVAAFRQAMANVLEVLGITPLEMM